VWEKSKQHRLQSNYLILVWLMDNAGRYQISEGKIALSVHNYYIIEIFENIKSSSQPDGL